MEPLQGPYLLGKPLELVIELGGASVTELGLALGRVGPHGEGSLGELEMPIWLGSASSVGAGGIHTCNECRVKAAEWCPGGSAPSAKKAIGHGRRESAHLIDQGKS